MRRLTSTLLLAGLWACEPAQEEPAVVYGETPTAVVVRVWVADSAYDLEFVRAADTARDGRLGRTKTWLVGAATIGMSPLPHRPDYYAVFPGDGADVATERPGSQAIQYDIYAGVVLDPEVPLAELRSAGAILRHSNESFRMPRGWTFDSIPGGAGLRDQVNLSGMEELGFFRNPDGTYPRILVMAMNVAAPIRRHRP
jgi:hypothetical protein